MSDSDDPESTIPWPGFVDILSTVIIVFVFFMMMTSVIIFVLSEQSKKSAVADAVQQSKSDIVTDEKKPVPDATLAPDVSNLLKEKDQLQKEVDRLTQLKNVLSESAMQAGKREGNEVRIAFGDMGATITPETEEVVKQALPFNGHIAITAYVPSTNNFTSMREIALNRALNLRNVLLQNGIASDHVSIKIATTEVKPATEEAQPNTDTPVNQESIYGSVTLTFSD